jgi:N-acetylneuraminic acid mutarotase
MNNIDFQNGVALGLAMGGVVEVEVPAKEEQEKTITITENSTTEILPDENKALSKVTVVTNVAGGGAEFNIAYGETPPEDTSKLWIKANEPNNVSVGSDIEGVESVASVGYLPTAVYNIGCARVGNKVYLFGGNSNTTYLNTINVFDTKTETITVLDTTLPSTVGGMGCASVGTKIYMFGGYGGGYSPYIWVFDTETETIAKLSTGLPNGARYIVCASVGTKIYLFGGQKASSGFLKTINVFDTETETITTLATTLPTSACSIGCSVVGTKIYLFGGQYSTSSSGYLNTINVFDTETNTITTLDTTLPDNTSDMVCGVIGTKIYLIGGCVNAFFTDRVDVFDTQTNTITTLETILPIATCYMCGACNGNKIYLFGGRTSGNNAPPTNTINCFTLTHELAQGDIEVQSGLLSNKFNLINTESAKVQIGVENVYVGNENNEAERVDAYLHNGTEWVQI